MIVLFNIGILNGYRRVKWLTSRSELWNNKSWMLRQDNVSAQNALAVKQFLANKCIPVRDQILPLVTFACSPK
jgi:hypothetical protein